MNEWYIAKLTSMESDLWEESPNLTKSQRQYLEGEIYSARALAMWGAPEGLVRAKTMNVVNQIYYSYNKPYIEYPKIQTRPQRSVGSMTNKQIVFLFALFYIDVVLCLLLYTVLVNFS